jgi:tetratricopeptide (TPR) repeat protein
MIRIKKYYAPAAALAVAFMFLCCNSDRNTEISSITTADAARLKMLVHDANTLMFPYPDSALRSIREIRTLAVKSRDDTVMMTYFTLSAFLNSCAKINYPRAKQFADSAVSLAEEKHSSKLIFMATYCKGLAFLGSNDRADSAIYFHLKAKTLYVTDTTVMPNPGMAASLFGNIGIMLLRQRNYDKAQPYLEKALHFKSNIKDTNGIFQSVIYLAAIEMETANMPKAYRYLQQDRHLAAAAGDSFNLNLAEQDLGKYYYYNKEYDSALHYLITALHTAELRDYPFRTADYHVYVANIYLERGLYRQATYWLNKGAKIFGEEEKEEYLPSLKLYYETLADRYHKTGRMAEAYYALNKAYLLRNRLASIDKNAAILDRERDIEEMKLRQEKEMQSQQIETQKSMMFLIVISSILFVVIVVLFISNRHKKKVLKMRANNMLLEQKAFFNQLNPHFIFNTLAPLQNKIIKGDETDALEYLASFGKLMRNMLDNQRVGYITVAFKISFLKNYLALQQQRLEGNFSYDINLTNNLEPETAWIPAMLIQPLVENAVEHGVKGLKDGHISIHLSRRGRYIIVRITDNGRGLPENEWLKNNHALHMLSERIALYKTKYKDSDLHIADNAAGRGVTTTIILPYFKKSQDKID